MTAKKLRAALALFCLGLGSVSPGARRPAPAWWDLVLRLKTEGDYRVEEPGTLFSGTFRLAVRWAGRLEPDEDDYLLVRFENKLTGWEIRETPPAAGSFRIMSQKDIAARPAFNLQYVLKKGGSLYLEFFIEGFPVPLNLFAENFPLHLPCSEEIGLKPGGIGYNLSLVEGSNRIAIPEDEIFRGPVKKSFSWTWKRQEWVSRQNRSIFTAGSHKVSLTVTLTPHQEEVNSRH